MLVTGTLLVGTGLFLWTRFGRNANQQVSFMKQSTPLPETEEQQKQQLERLQETDIVDIEEWIDHYINVSSVSLGLAVAGIWFPPLQIVSAAGLTYLTIPIWQQTYKDLSNKRLTTNVLESIALPAFVLSGYILAAAISNWLYYFGLKLIEKSKHYSNNQIKTQLTQPLKTVWIQKDEHEIEIAYEAIQIDDLVVVQAGEVIPVDGMIVEGIASIDERMMTGESQLAEKAINDSVFAFTIVLAGKVLIKVEKTGAETVAAQIEQALEQTSYYTAAVELRTKEIIDRATLPTLALTTLTLPTAGLTSALIVLDSPLVDSIMITGPLSILVHLSMASKQNILIKDGRVLEILQDIDTIVFDKTGTLTHDQPHLGKIYPFEAYSEQEILTYAAIAESKQSHPIARAILKAAEQYHLKVDEIKDMQYELGYGIKVSLDGKKILVGSARFMQMENIEISQQAKQLEQHCHQQGYSLVYVAISGQLAGLIELHPTIRPEAQKVVTALKQRGLSLYIISGDHHNPTKALAEKLGIEHYFAETLPEHKADLIEQLQTQGKSVCFIGDGVNDAIALKTAQISVSLQGASNIAMDTAQVVLLDENLMQLLQLFNLADSLNNNVRKSLILDIVPNAICISGALFFHLSIYGALGIYSVGLLGNLANGISPLFSQKNKQPMDTTQ